VDQVAENTTIALRAVSASPSDVVRSVIHVVSGASADLARVWRRLLASVPAPAFAAASTLLG
jgi:hypothetical protein